MRSIFLAGLLLVGMAHADDTQEQPTDSEALAPEPLVNEDESTTVRDILNFHEMTDNIAIGGQPTVSQLAQVANAGYSVVVNLAMHDSDNAIPEEGSVTASLGMSYVHIPVPSDAPTSTHVRKFFNVMDAFEGEKVFVHCVVSGRVSAFINRYMTLRMGTSAEQATSPLLQRWLPAMEEPWTSIMNLELDDIDH
ncbi:MAG: protein tyrosine phosphatase family protein [Gammaproteobacteria bacterium]|nr:protein tyrosine phosphatase family protein [Gammaproteobacteria bacterium]